MQKADFEKNVQQKMQELRFQPSQEVWKRVEAGIATERRRRPVVFWFLFAGLLLAGGSFYFISTRSNKNIVGNKTQQPGQAIAEKQETKTETQGTSTGAASEHASTSIQNKKPVTNSEASTIDQTKSQAERTNNRHDQILPLKPTENTANNFPEKQDLRSDYYDGAETYSNERALHIATPIAQRHQIAVTNINLDQLNAEPENNPLLSTIPAVATSSKSSSPIKETNWQFGISAAGGVSDLGEQLLQSASAANLYFDPLQTAGGGTVPHPKPSDVQKGVSFSFGVFANKTLGKKWKLGLGLGYQYFSNTIKVGERVDSAAFVNQNNFSLDRVNQYYKSAGNDPYHNQYHFISVPVNMQWQFARQFTWENGLIVSRMIKTNALHYDGVSGRYYEDDELFNKYQLSASTAVLFAFHKNKIQLGPQLQYAFTNLMQTGTGNPKHLRSVSIKANIELWKN